MMNRVKRSPRLWAAMIAICFMFGATVFAMAEDETHKLLINKKDLSKLGIQESAGQYNPDEQKGVELPSTYSNHYDFKGTTRIKPGWWARCEGNFVLKGLGPGVAKVQVALDADTHQNDDIENGSEKVYNVIDHRDGINLSSHANLSDVGMVANHSKQAVVEMRCYK